MATKTELEAAFNRCSELKPAGRSKEDDEVYGLLVFFAKAVVMDINRAADAIERVADALEVQNAK